MSSAPVAVQPLPQGGVARMVGRRARDWIPAILVLVLTLGVCRAA